MPSPHGADDPHALPVGATSSTALRCQPRPAAPHADSLCERLDSRRWHRLSRRHPQTVGRSQVFAGSLCDESFPRSFQGARAGRHTGIPRESSAPRAEFAPLRPCPLQTTCTLPQALKLFSDSVGRTKARMSLRMPWGEQNTAEAAVYEAVQAVLDANAVRTQHRSSALLLASIAPLLQAAPL